MNRVDSGLEVIDLHDDASFARRQLHARHLTTPMDGINRIARSFVEAPSTVLQELVQSAIDLCGADSAGISLEISNGTEAHFYEWVATAGQYAKLQHALFPREPSVCGVCLERGRPQRFRVGKQFFEALQVTAAEVTDGFLLPLQMGGRRGTIFIVAHGRQEAFDQDDLRIMRILADMVVIGVRQQERTATVAVQSDPFGDGDTTALANKFDKSLQGMKSALYLAEWSQGSANAKRITDEMAILLEKLSVLVRRLLRPVALGRPN